MAEIRIDQLSTKAATALESTDNIITFDNTGDTNQTPFFEAVSRANEVNECECIKSASLTIASADVLTLNTTPIEIVAAQGVGKYIEVISASVNIDFNSVAYATNTTLQLINSGSTVEQFASPTLDASIAQIANFSAATPSAAQVQLTANTALNVSVKSGDPTAGDSDITVYVLYRVVTI